MQGRFPVNITRNESLLRSINPQTLEASVADISVHENLFRGIKVLKVSSIGQIQERVLMLSADKLKIYLERVENGNGNGGGGVNAALASINSAQLLKYVKKPGRIRHASSGSSMITTVSHPNYNGSGNNGNGNGASVTVSGDLQRPQALRATSRSESCGGESEVRAFDVSSLSRIQLGSFTYRFDMARRNNSFTILDNQAVSIIYDGDKYEGNKSLDLIIIDDADRQNFVRMVKLMIHAYRNARAQVDRDALLLRYTWLNRSLVNEADVTIGMSEFQTILKMINCPVKITDEKWRNAVNKYGEGDSLKRRRFRKAADQLKFQQCLWLLEDVKREAAAEQKHLYSTPVDRIWKDLFGIKDGSKVSVEVFLSRFLKKKQMQLNSGMGRAEKIFATFNDIEMAKLSADASHDKMKFLTKSRFEVYLESSMNDAFDPSKELTPDKLREKLDKPITHYWINSSHNTYLTGDQLKSHSSTGMYMEVLAQGCRCLELDIWDGDKDDNTPIPIITHGGTLTSKIKFEDVVKAINMFLTQNPNCYPLILSLENHCSIPYQDQMTLIMKKVFGERLYIPHPFDLDYLPSPENLRGKVVLKGKKESGIDMDEDEEEIDERSSHSIESSLEALMMNSSNSLGSIPELVKRSESGNTEIPRHPIEITSQLQGKAFRISNEAPLSYSDRKLLPRAEEFADEENDRLLNSKQMSMKTVQTVDTQHVKIAPSLAEITLFHGTRHKSWEQSNAMPTHHMHSFNDSKVSQRLCRQGIENIGEWMKYNSSRMSRLYPSGLRYKSSNFNPLLGWSTGSQLIALNFQTTDEFMHVNHGRFRQYGGCGYIPRPITSFLSRNGTISRDREVLLKIRVMSGSRLPKPHGTYSGDCISPYVKVSVHDVTIDKVGAREVTKTCKTQAIKGNGLNPFWDHHDFFEFIIKRKSVAILLFTVHNESDDAFIACSSIPISCLRLGYRSVKLFDAWHRRSGAFAFASLLVEIEMYDHQKYKKAEEAARQKRRTAGPRFISLD